MFTKIDSLPSSQGQRSLVGRDQERRLGECRLDVARHIVWAFLGMKETFLIERDQPFEKEFEIVASRGIGILLDGEARRSVLKKQVDKLRFKMRIQES